MRDPSIIESGSACQFDEAQARVAFAHEHRQCVRATKAVVQHAWAAGRILLGIKKEVKHGKWTAKLAAITASAGCSARTGRVYCQLAQGYPDGPSADLTLDQAIEQIRKQGRLDEIAELIRDKHAEVEKRGGIGAPGTENLSLEISDLLRESAHLHGMTDDDLEAGAEFSYLEAYAFQQRVRDTALRARAVALAARGGIGSPLPERNLTELWGTKLNEEFERWLRDSGAAEILELPSRVRAEHREILEGLQRIDAGDKMIADALDEMEAALNAKAR